MSQKRVKFDLDDQDRPTQLQQRDWEEKRRQAGEGEEEQENGSEENGEGHKMPFNKRFKHTLDSDEEDDEVDEEKYNFLAPDQFNGEEEGAARVEDEVKMTPFNMNEELEEGHFDKDGTYIFRRDPDEIRDSWLDNIDWIKLKSEKNPEPNFKRAGAIGRGEEEDGKDNDDSNEVVALEKVDVNDCLSRLLPFLKPGETVQKAMQRLQKGRMSVTQKLKLKSLKKKGAKLSGQQLVQLESEDNISKEINVISELVDKLATKDPQVYQKTYESIEFLIEKEKNKYEFAECADDMFGEDFDSESTAVKAVEEVESK